MASLLESILSQIGDAEIGKLSQAVGESPEATKQAVPSALATLVAGLSRNAKDSGGAQALHNALQANHDGSILDNLTSFLDQGDTSPGEAILKHVLGGNQSAVQNGLGQSTGLTSKSMGSLLAMLAPMVLGALGRAQRKQGLNLSGLSSLLQGEAAQAKNQAPQGMDIISSLLDRDGDGSVVDDITRLGGDLLGGILGSKS